MASLVLSKPEVIEITGRRRYKGQIEALQDMKIPFRLRPDGSPLILRAVIEMELGYASKETKQTPPRLRVPEAQRVLLRKKQQMDSARR